MFGGFPVEISDWKAANRNTWARVANWFRWVATALSLYRLEQIKIVKRTPKDWKLTAHTTKMHASEFESGNPSITIEYNRSQIMNTRKQKLPMQESCCSETSKQSAKRTISEAQCAVIHKRSARFSAIHWRPDSNVSNSTLNNQFNAKPPCSQSQPPTCGGFSFKFFPVYTLTTRNEI